MTSERNARPVLGAQPVGNSPGGSGLQPFDSVVGHGRTAFVDLGKFDGWTTLAVGSPSAKRAVLAAREEARTDELTGLPNRAAAKQRFAEFAWRRAQPGPPTSLVVVGLDFIGFKHYNDHYSTEAGDAVLRAFGRALVGAVSAVGLDRPENGSFMAARVGGDEFLIIGERSLLPASTRTSGAAHLAPGRPVEGERGQLQQLFGAMAAAMPEQMEEAIAFKHVHRQRDTKRRGVTIEHDAVALRFGMVEAEYREAPEYEVEQGIAAQMKTANLYTQAVKLGAAERRRSSFRPQDRWRWGAGERVVFGDPRMLVRSARQGSHPWLRLTGVSQASRALHDLANARKWASADARAAQYMVQWSNNGPDLLPSSSTPTDRPSGRDPFGGGRTL